MPTIKGTASISSTSALSKLLRTTPFPPHFSTKVDTTKLHRGVLSHWIEQRIEQILGFEDEIVSSTATNLFLPESVDDGKLAEVDPRKAQLDLVGFLGEKESAEFASELWEMMIDGASRKSGIPLILVERKKEEMKRAREEEAQRNRGYGNSYGGQAKRGVAGGDPEMNAFVREAARRAEMARAALGNNHDNHGGERHAAHAAAAAVPPSRSPPREMARDRNFRDRNDGYPARNDGYAARNERERNDGYAARNDYYIDRKGDTDEFGRRREGHSFNNDRKFEAKKQRKRSPSPSRSRSRSSSTSYSRSSGSYSASPSPQREKERKRNDRRHHGRRERDRDDRRRGEKRHRSRSRDRNDRR
jgi:serine/arginine repetitive matrix protein 1